MRRRLLAGVIALAFVLSAPAQDERDELGAVRERIEELEARIAAEVSGMDADRQALRGLEKQIAEQNGALERIRLDRMAEQGKLDGLNGRVAASRVELSGERDALARQVLLSYMTGREALLKVVLNQEKPAELGRMVTWYDYFNDYRSNRIAAVSGELEELAALLRETRASEQRLANLTRNAERELAELETARAERNSIIAGREARLKESGRTLDTLREDEQRLADLVVELGDISAAFPAGSEEPFENLKGRLAWPAVGQIDGEYGELRNGGPLRWNGVLLAADPGTPVRAVYHGRVRFSDWLPGMGMLMIVDHGDGYLSLYGHNEVLLREFGEWVTPGDELARVGSAAGGRSGLYFEIRHDGKPIDPQEWMRGEPGKAAR